MQQGKDQRAEATLPVCRRLLVRVARLARLLVVALRAVLPALPEAATRVEARDFTRLVTLDGRLRTAATCVLVRAVAFRVLVRDAVWLAVARRAVVPVATAVPARRDPEGSTCCVLPWRLERVVICRATRLAEVSARAVWAVVRPAWP